MMSSSKMGLPKVWPMVVKLDGAKSGQYSGCFCVVSSSTEEAAAREQTILWSRRMIFESSLHCFD
jgi:hypothetical protein